MLNFMFKQKGLQRQWLCWMHVWVFTVNLCVVLIGGRFNLKKFNEQNDNIIGRLLLIAENLCMESCRMILL